MAIRGKVVKYILELTNDQNLDPNMNLFESGTLTSLDILDLLSFIEETFNISFSEDDITMENFGTMNNIVQLIERLKREG